MSNVYVMDHPLITHKINYIRQEGGDWLQRFPRPCQRDRYAHVL